MSPLSKDCSINYLKRSKFKISPSKYQKSWCVLFIKPKKKRKIGNPARTAIHVSENVRILRKLNNNAIDESSNKFYKYGG